MEILTERMNHAAAHIATMYDAEWEATQLREGATEINKLRTALDVAMATLEQISVTPRNTGARRNAAATLHFLQTQLASSVLG